MSASGNNSLMILVDLRAGKARVIDDSRPIRELADAARAAQGKGELRLMSTVAA